MGRRSLTSKEAVILSKAGMVPPHLKPPEPVEAPGEPPESPYTPANLIEVTGEAAGQPYTPPQFDHKQAKADPEMEMAVRVLARRRLLSFIKRFRPKYQAGWVHEDICRRLEQFVKDVEQGLAPRLLLLMCPRSGKSEISSRHLPAWILGQHPDWEIIAASHTLSLSLSFSRYIRDLMEDPAYKVIFPTASLDPGSRSVENWNLRQGGGYLAAGVNSGITGRGAHVLLLDDVVRDLEAADSTTIRDSTWEWYVSTAYTRLAPGGGVLGILTHWHDDDWAGRIQQVMASGDGDVFEIVKYPAINDYGDEYILASQPGQPIVQLLPGTPIPHGAKLTRVKDTAIHPARYSTEAMLKIKRNMFAAGQQRIWSSLYQQTPAPDDGLFFTAEMLKFYSSPPSRTGRTVYQAWDFAIATGQENDYTVGVTLLQDENDTLHVLDVLRFKSGDSFFIIDSILDYARQYDVDLLGFEDGQIWKTLQAQFEKRCSERRYYPSHEILKPLTDKLVRAHPLRGRMQLGKVLFDANAPWWQDTKQELLRFPAGKHDDVIDSLSWAVRLTLGRHAPRMPDNTPKMKSWRDALPGLGSGTGSHMSA